MSAWVLGVGYSFVVEAFDRFFPKGKVFFRISKAFRNFVGANISQFAPDNNYDGLDSIPAS